MRTSTFLSSHWSFLKLELRLNLRQNQDLLSSLLFFIITATIFPLSLPQQQIMALETIGGSILWVLAFLVMLLNMDLIFGKDYQNGTLESVVLSPFPLTSYVFIKCFVHWVLSALPLLITAIPLAYSFGLSSTLIPSFIGALALGTPSLTLLGAIGSSLVLGARRPGMILGSIIFPLLVPLLIFGTSALHTIDDPLLRGSSVQLLFTYLCFLLPVTPILCAFILKHAIYTR